MGDLVFLSEYRRPVCDDDEIRLLSRFLAARVDDYPPGSQSRIRLEQALSESAALGLTASRLVDGV